MPEDKRPLKVFLSYASQDKPVVRELSRRLVGEGWIDTWLDEKNLLPGQDWRANIEEAVETSDVVIICVSSNSVTKEGFVQKELRYAREIALEKPEETIFLIPLRLDECDVPRGLRFFQWADYFGDKKGETYRVLLASLKMRYEQKLKIEEKERALYEKEKQEREVAEKIKREKAHREATEKTAREKAELLAAEKAIREKVQLEAIQTAVRETAKKNKRNLDTQSFLGIGWVIGWVGIIGTIAIIVFIGGLYLKGMLSNPIPTPTQLIVLTPTAQLSPQITDDKDVQMILIPMLNDVSAFYIDKFEVTNLLYKTCVSARVCQLPENFGSSTRTSYFDNSAFDNYPVIYVDWNMAMGYCEWRGGNLPSEAQWTNAAFGTDGRTYPWGENIDSSYANYNQSIGDTTGVGSYESGKSFYGVYDMGGNVAEWTTDLISPIFGSPGGTPEPTPTIPEYVGMVHGGSWKFDDMTLKRDGVSMVSPSYMGDTVGFRCVRDVSSISAGSTP